LPVPLIALHFYRVRGTVRSNCVKPELCFVRTPTIEFVSAETPLGLLSACVGQDALICSDSLDVCSCRSGACSILAGYLVFAIAFAGGRPFMGKEHADVSSELVR
jgi:hypothetical protein